MGPLQSSPTQSDDLQPRMLHSRPRHHRLMSLSVPTPPLPTALPDPVPRPMNTLAIVYGVEHPLSSCSAR